MSQSNLLVSGAGAKWSFAAYKHMFKEKLARKPPLDLQSVAVKTWEMAPADASVAPPAFYLPNQLERVTGWQFYPFEHPRRTMEGNGLVQHGPTRAFLLKDATREELLHAVRVVAAGDALLAPSVTRRLIAEFIHRPPVQRPDAARLDALTQREREVLALIARGLSNAEIAAELIVGDATVKSHVAHVLMTHGLRDRIQAVILAYELGIV